MLRALAAVVAMAVVAAAAAWLWEDYERSMRRPLAETEPVVHISVAAGAGVRAIADDLARRNLLSRPRYWAVEARRQGVSGALKAGEYEVPGSTTARQLLAFLVRGRVVQHAITLVEGWNFEQVLSAIRAAPRLAHTLDGMGPQAVMAKLGLPDMHPEGRFFPDTYHFPAGTTDVAFLQRAHRTMERVLAEAWEARGPDLPYQRPYDALIMASIIEKETARPEERARIAGVFVRRLRRGMRLETDPTVIYGMGARFDGNLRRRDLRTDTPYNTYTRKGLPPTPIAMPGIGAIRAALAPADGDALFFVAKGDGTHQFSATYDEHRAAVRRYQRARRATRKGEG